MKSVGKDSGRRKVRGEGGENHLFPSGSLQSHSKYRNVQVGRIKSSFDSCLKAEFLMNLVIKLDAVFTVNTGRLQQTRLVVTSQ